jgi:hypothetical protein
LHTWVLLRSSVVVTAVGASAVELTPIRPIGALFLTWAGEYTVTAEGQYELVPRGERTVEAA